MGVGGREGVKEVHKSGFKVGMENSCVQAVFEKAFCQVCQCGHPHFIHFS